MKLSEKMRKIYFLYKNGDVLNTIKKKWFRGFLKKLFYTRKITFTPPVYECRATDYAYMTSKLTVLPSGEVKLFIQEVKEYKEKLEGVNN